MTDHSSRHVPTPTPMKLATKEPRLLHLLKTVQRLEGSPGSCSSTVATDLMNRVAVLFFPGSAPASLYPDLTPPDGRTAPLGTFEECKTVSNELLQFVPGCPPGCLCGWDLID